MKKGETTEMDWIPEDVWMCLGEEGIDMLRRGRVSKGVGHLAHV